MNISSKNEKLISIVTVCYNASDCIVQTIESILQQKCCNYEYIIKDGSSTDKTIDIIKPYTRIFNKRGIPFTVRSTRDCGIYDAMNEALEMCSGEWVIYLNAGDIFCNADVLNVAEDVLSTGTFDIIYGKALLSTQGKISKRENYPMCCLAIGIIPFIQQAAFTKKDLLLKRRFETKYSLAGDYEFYLYHYLQGARYKEIDIDVCVYDTTGVSNTNRILTGQEYNAAKDKYQDSFKFKIIETAGRFILKYNKLMSKVRSIGHK